MEEIMQSNSYFIIPLSFAYCSICGFWFLLVKFRLAWTIENIQASNHKWIDLILALVACFGVIAVGQVYSAGLLIPKPDHKVGRALIWGLNNVIIFSPIFITIILRKQSLNTLFLSGNNFIHKSLFGIAASLIGVFLFVVLRSEVGRFPEILKDAFTVQSLSNFPAIFFENVALAFLFVRLRWAIGLKWSIIIPAILFASAHIPGSIAEGDPWSHIMTFFFLTGSLTTVILYTAYRSRDIIWLGFVHYFMDVAIKAF